MRLQAAANRAASKQFDDSRNRGKGGPPTEPDGRARRHAHLWRRAGATSGAGRDALLFRRGHVEPARLSDRLCPISAARRWLSRHRRRRCFGLPATVLAVGTSSLPLGESDSALVGVVVDVAEHSRLGTGWASAGPPDAVPGRAKQRDEPTRPETPWACRHSTSTPPAERQSRRPLPAGLPKPSRPPLYSAARRAARSGSSGTS